MSREVTRTSRILARRIGVGVVAVLVALMVGVPAEAATTGGKSGGSGVGGNGGPGNAGAVILPGQPGNCTSLAVACVPPAPPPVIERSGCSERRPFDGGARRSCHRAG